MKSIYFLCLLLLATSFLLFGCVEGETPQFSTSLLIRQSTDLDYNLFKQGVYDGNCLKMDGNKISVGSCLTVDANIPWEQLIDFPAGCGANQAVKIVGSSLVCIDLPIDTNTQTAGFTNVLGKWLIDFNAGQNAYIDGNLSANLIHTETFFLMHDQIVSPTTPDVNHLIIYDIDTQGTSRPIYKGSNGQEITIGRDNVIIVRNTSGVGMTKGQVVYITGATGNVPNVGLAKADSKTTLPAVGILMANLSNNSFGNAMILGNLTMFDTSAFSIGDRLFVSDTNAGALTNVRPIVPSYAQRIGSVLVSGVGNGAVEVTVAPFIGGEETGTDRNFNIQNEAPELKLTINSTNNYFKLFKSDASSIATFSNRITWSGIEGIWEKYNNVIPANSDTVSTDGRIPLGTAGKGDDVYALSPSVIKDGNIYKMWYSGNDGARWRIYYATSGNGLDWNKYNNVAPANSDTVTTDGRIASGTSAAKGDFSRAANASVIKDGNIYKMWYSGNDGIAYRIYYATSPDGLTWTKYDNNIPAVSDGSSTNGRIPTGTIGTGDDGGTSSPSVIKDGNTYKMWYSGSDGSNIRLYYATSPDGLVWTKYNNVIPANSDVASTNGRVPLGSAGRGDDADVVRPSVIKSGNYKMWYAGNDGSNYRLYYATSPDGLVWTKYDNNVPANSDTTSTDWRMPLGTVGKGDDVGSHFPIVILDGTTYKMWYSGADGTNIIIYYATAPSLVNYEEVQILKSENSLVANEKGITTLGNNDSRVVVNGQTIRFNVGGVEKINIDADGNFNALNIKGAYYSSDGNKGLTKNMTILKDTDLVMLTKTFCDLNFKEGILVGSTC